MNKYLEQIAKTEVIDLAYGDKNKTTIGKMFPVAFEEINKKLELLALLLIEDEAYEKLKDVEE